MISESPQNCEQVQKQQGSILESANKKMKYILIFTVFCIAAACSQKEEQLVLIQPYGDIDNEILEEVQKSISKSYGFKVYLADRIEMPNSAFVNIKSPRYRGDSILAIQRRIKPDTIDFVVGLTTFDISTTKRDERGNILKPESRYKDWGIFGLGYQPGSCSIVSSYRLTPNNRELMLTRIKKVCNHELGHNFGLDHCTSSPNCVMRDAAETIKTIDTVDDTLCNSCKGKIGR